MKKTKVTLVRVYITEEKAHLETLLKRLHDWGKVRGVTVFRGIAGYGDSGVIHASSLIDISLDLPVVIEFFEDTGKAGELMEYLQQEIRPGHIVSWPVELVED